MMILFFDTETTGFVDERMPFDADHQPHLVQLAAQLCDHGGKVFAGFSLIVEPGIKDGNLIPEKAAAVHGVTSEIATKFGVSRSFALQIFSHLYQRCDLIVAHNVKFDKAVIEITIGREYGRLKELSRPTFCTMESAAPIVNLPPTERMIAAGIKKPKAPKLEECMKFFFGEALDGAHDAMVDVEACRKVYFRIAGAEAA
jgi:DNA polymerase III subunit epsilon